MQLQLRNFASLVGGAAAAVQGAARQLVDLSVGSTLRAVLEADASIALWMQWLIVQVLQTTRAATSQGADLDSWMADFSVTRLPAVAASGVVTFSRFAAGVTALVPLGTGVRTGDGAQSFVVVADTRHPAFVAVLGGYGLASGIASVDVPVVAVAAGASGNVQAGSVSLIAAALPGVDLVGNALAFLGGLDGEADAALRGRFENFLASRNRATLVAIGYAVASVRQGLRYAIAENALPDGSVRIGSFVVTVDDGSGVPSAALLQDVGTAVEAMRPVGSSFAVQPPVVVTASVSMLVTTAAGAVHGEVAAAVAAAVAAYVDQLPIGAALAWSRLTQLAFQAGADVVNVSAVLLNGGTADLVPGAAGVVKAGAVVVA